MSPIARTTHDPTPPAHEAAARRDWPAYFDRMAGKPARETLLAALDAFGPIDPVDPPLACDLACGSGTDAAALLARGWRVWAHDPHPDALRRVREHPVCAAALADRRLTLSDADFASAAPPPAMLVNASFCLPFCPPGDFDRLWARIERARLPGSRFAGQFFGDRDDWAALPDRTHHTRAQVLALFPNDLVESLREEDRPSTHDRAPKHWHVFHLVTRRR